MPYKDKAYRSDRDRERREKKKAKGICYDCDLPSVAGNRCQQHMDGIAAWRSAHKERVRGYTNALRNKRKALGLCIECEHATERGTLRCGYHSMLNSMPRMKLTPALVRVLDPVSGRLPSDVLARVWDRVLGRVGARVRARVEEAISNAV